MQPIRVESYRDIESRGRWSISVPRHKRQEGQEEDAQNGVPVRRGKEKTDEKVETQEGGNNAND